MHPNEIKKITKYSPFVVMGALALVFSVFLTVVTTQQNQDNRSKAAIVNGDYNGSLTTDSNIVNGSVNGDVIGSNNTISGNVSGCVKGNNNIIGGRVSGAVSGTGNIISLGSGSGACLSTQTTTTATLTPIADAVVYQSSASNNYGTKSVIEVETESGRNQYSYLKFDLTPYAGKTITSAKLRLRTNGDSDAGSSGTTSVKGVSDTTWSETGITYNNKPSLSSTILGTLNPRSANTWYESSLSASSLQYAVGGLLSIGLTNPTDDQATFHSRESSYDPELVVTFTQTSSPTVVPTQAPTATLAPSATNVPTPTPTPAPGVTATQAPSATPTQSGPTAIPTAIPSFAPTATIAPGNASVKFSILLHGVGKGGDAVTPNASGNMNPVHPQRTVQLDVLNATNQLIAVKEGVATFDPASGSFKGEVDLGTDVTTGLYTIKVKTDQYLRTIFPGIQNITSGMTLPLNPVSLVVGDINNDNAINIVDYNILLGCYSDLLPAVSCNDTDDRLADINDDSFVNQFDYNLFIRELTNIGGQ